MMLREGATLTTPDRPHFRSMWDCAMLIGAPQWSMGTSIYVTGLLALNVLMQRYAQPHRERKAHHSADT